MNNKISIFNLYFKFFFHFNKKQKIRTIFSLVLGLFSSFLELISVGSIIPFVLFITNPEKIYESSFYKIIVGKKLFSLDELIFFSFIFFIGIVIISSVIKIIHLKLNCLVSYGIINTFSDILFQGVANQNYKAFENLNIKDVVTTISLRSQSVGESNFFIISFASAAMAVFFLLFNIIYFAPIKILFLLIVVVFLYLVFWLSIKQKVKRHSKIFSENYQKLNKNISEMMYSYSDLLLYKLQNYFSFDFKKNNFFLRKSQGQIVFLNGYPLIIIQSIVIMGLVLFIYFLNYSGTLKEQLPFLILLVFSIQRIVPNMQTIFSSYTNLTYCKENLKKSFLLLNLNIQNSKKNLSYKSKIENEQFSTINIQNVKFDYLNHKKNSLLDNFNLEIKKGEKIALTGESGSGKSTLVKIILGFLVPIDGHILINGKKLDEQNLDWWHSIVAYIPQKIFILDEDLYENIALKKNITDKEKKIIDELLINLNLSDLLSSFKEKFLTLGGEDGKKFSGGQIQRIAIARAIFQKRSFIILDETFNALDKENAGNVIDILNKIPSLTFLLIVHSEDLVKNCERVFKIENKKIYEIKIS
jgi:ABC-type multidrug transport system fused ATPase/permease subunit